MKIENCKNIRVKPQTHEIIDKKSVNLVCRMLDILQEEEGEGELERWDELPAPSELDNGGEVDILVGFNHQYLDKFINGKFNQGK